MTAGQASIAHWTRDNLRRLGVLAGTDSAPSPAAARLPASLWVGVVAALGLAAVLVVLFDVAPVVRAPIVLGFLLLAPGWAVVRMIDVPDTAMRISLTLAISVSIVGLITLVQAYAGVWQPGVMVLISVLVTVFIALIEMVRSRSRGVR